MEAYRCI